MIHLHKIRLWLLPFLLCLFLPFPALAENLPVRQDLAIWQKDETKVLVIATTIGIPAGYHAYANEPGESGRPTVLELVGEDGRTLAVRYPEGAMQRDLFDPSLSVFVYEGEVTLFAEIPMTDLAGNRQEKEKQEQPGNGQPGSQLAEATGNGSASARKAGKKEYAGPGKSTPAGLLANEYTARLSLLLCSSRHCLPVGQEWQFRLPNQDAIAALPMVSEQHWAGEWARLSGKAPSQPRLAPTVERPADDHPGLDALPGSSIRLQPRYFQPGLEVGHLGLALVLGLLAGLILNAMPCVLPVLTLKFAGLLLPAESGNGDPDNDDRRFARVREYALFFALGILTLFTILAMALGLADLVWGQLWQSQAVILGLLLVVFCMGLSLFGLFSLPVIDIRADRQEKNPRISAWFGGFFATFLATPCSGPLLGGVLGWAFGQPLAILVLVFWSVGLGMALPYLLVAAFPAITSRLPRPGQWMLVLERLAGFLLLATALYLLSILPAGKHVRVLAVLLGIAFMAWIWGRFCGLAAPRPQRWLIGVGSLVAAGVLVVWALAEPAPEVKWQGMGREEFATSLGKTPMLVEFTADWCPNCKFLETTVLDSASLRQWQKEYGFALVRIDLTGANAFGVWLLETLGSRSIPVTALFPAGEGAASPLVLRDLYGKKQLEKAMRDCFTTN